MEILALAMVLALVAGYCAAIYGIIRALTSWLYLMSTGLGGPQNHRNHHDVPRGTKEATCDTEAEDDGR